MMSDAAGSYSRAVLDFQHARHRADMERIVARLTGKSAGLLSYNKVRRQLRARVCADLGLHNIPLDAIVGSVGRYTDFSRSFLPLQDHDAGRWARVKVAMTGLAGVPAIDVYKIGDAYFVSDGNHRVSVARQLDATHIEAYVVEVCTDVPLAPDVQPDELIIKAEYAGFLERTRLNELRPESDLTVTAPAKYDALLDHIEVHRYFMGLEQGGEVAYEESVTHWHDLVYLPVVEIIRQRGILRDFPGRTETDLYLWIAEHRSALQEWLGWEIGTEAAADDLAAQHSPRPGRVVARFGGRLMDAVTPNGLQTGPSPGAWRAGAKDRLFADILAPLDGSERSWLALEQALLVAQREDARLQGLFVVSSESERDSAAAKGIRDRFDWRCGELGIPGNLVVRVGQVAPQICDSARWAHLVVVSLAHPPARRPLARLSSGFRTLVHRCPRPILAVPGDLSSMRRVLLAYDGSAKAREALFLAAYIASRWGTKLLGVTVSEKGEAVSVTIKDALAYLQSRGVEAQWVTAEGNVPEAVLGAANEHDADLLMMGGYARSPLVEVVLGSAVDQVLREVRVPILICR